MALSSRNGVLLALAVVALCALRAFHLEADTPRQLTSGSVGLFVDEGYKTLDARNSVLFGSARWNPADDYPGWAERSSLTHAAWLGAFRLFGPRLGAARAVTVLWFGAFLAAFVLGVRSRYPPWLVLVGVLLLGAQHTIFFFSRVALQEIPLSLCLYGFLFYLARRDDRPAGPAALAVFVLLLAVATFGIKQSAPGYFLPLAVGVVVASRDAWERDVGRRTLAPAASLLLLAGLGGWMLWANRTPAVDLGGAVLLGNLLKSALMYSTAPLMAAALLAAFHALLVGPRRFLQSPYRSALLMLIVLGPLFVTTFRYRPLRYYAPFVPGYVLLLVEYVHLRPWRSPVPDRVRPLAAAVLLPLFAWGVYCAGRSVHRYVLQPALPGWGMPEGLPREAVAVAALLAGVGLWVFRHRLAPLLPAAALVMALLACARDARIVGGFLVAPTFDARDLARSIEAELPPNAVVAGDWAPMLTLGTSLPSLYMNPEVNRPERIHELGATHLVLSGRWDPRSSLEARGIRFAPPAVQGTYAGWPVSVLPMVYPRERPLIPAVVPPPPGARSPPER